MNKIGCLIFLLTVISCNQTKYKLQKDCNENVIFNSEIEYNKDSLILANLKIRNDSLTNKFRGIDGYRSYFIDSILNISFNWGVMNGKTLTIELNKGKANIKLENWGCTTAEFYDYNCIERQLILSKEKFEVGDTLIGYLKYFGEQNIEGMNSIAKEYYDSLKPEKSIIEGQFIVEIYDDKTKRNKEFSIQNIFLKNKWEKINIKFEEKISSELDLRFLNLKELPKDLQKMKNLKKLNLFNNRLKNSDLKILCELKQLEEINLSFNQISRFPKELLRLPNLKKLDLSINKIQDLPMDDIVSSNIEELNLKRNNFTKRQLKKINEKIKKENSH